MTDCMKIGEVLGEKVASPLYVAWSVVLPGGNVEVVKDAFALPFRDAVPRRVNPKRKLTVPLGVPAVVDVTVAVNVTGCPNVEGFCDDAREVEVAAPEEAFTICERAEELLGLWPASPL
jgi:hypothetical protein